MFRVRVVTAAVLLGVLFAVLSYGDELGWNLFVLLILLGAFWEWARLGRFTSRQSILYAVSAVALCMLGVYFTGLQSSGFPLLAIASVFWVAFAPWCLGHVSLGVLARPLIYGAVGLVLIAAAGFALIVAKSHGIVFLVSAMAICFTADILAYVFGKAFGKHKLAPRISPGKSWEGAVGGALSVLALSWLVVLLSNHFPVLRGTWQVVALKQWHPVVFSFWLVVLSAYSVVGDLFESMLKRRAGVKDSSQLLPGHGGILDRIDAQLPVLPLAILLVSAIAA